MDRSDETLTPSRPVDEKGRLLDMPPEFFEEGEDLFTSDGSIGESSRKFLQGWMDHYVRWIKKHAA
jgi:hypothetical protein